MAADVKAILLAVAKVTTEGKKLADLQDEKVSLLATLQTTNDVIIAQIPVVRQALTDLRAVMDQ